MRAISISSLYMSFLAVICLLAFVGCASGGGDAPINTPGSQNVTMTNGGWTRVSAEWTFGEIDPGACTHAKIVVDADASFEITDCAGTKKGIIAEADFAILQARMKPIMNNIAKNAMCDLQPVADLSWINRVTTADGKSKRVYYSSSMGTCATGSRTHGEALDATLDSLKTKYSAEPTSGTETSEEIIPVEEGLGIES